MSNDRGLERAILAGAIAYGPERVRLQPRPTPTRGRNGAREFSGKQGGDLDGWLVRDGKSIPLLVEAKASLIDRIDFDRFTERQLADLAAYHAAGNLAWIIAAFDHVGETFRIEWGDVADFFAAPWRRSLSLWHCRAVGLLVPDIAESRPEPREVMFLDGKEWTWNAAAWNCLGRSHALIQLEREKGAARPRRAPKPAPPSDLRDVPGRAARAAAAGTRAARKAKR